MNKPNKIFTVSEAKIEASMLLKSLHSEDDEKSKQAAKRLQRLPEFKKFSIEEIIRSDVKRKNALAVIACEKRFKSWAELKSHLPFIQGGSLNPWFANYAEAKAYLKSKGGFLFPYKNQFFICDADYIKRLGLDPGDPDWKLIGYDWANPESKEAWKKLNKKWREIQKIQSKGRKLCL